MPEYRDYLVNLTPEQVLERLRSGVGSENILGFLDPTDKAVVGHVKTNRFRLRVPRGFSSNAFAPYLYGWIEPRPEGTRIRTRLSMHPFATGFIIAGPLACVAASLAGLGGARIGASAEATFLGFAGGAVLFGGMVWLMRQIDRSHDKILFGFVESVFRDAQITPRPAP